MGYTLSIPVRKWVPRSERIPKTKGRPMSHPDMATEIYELMVLESPRWVPTKFLPKLFKVSGPTIRKYLRDMVDDVMFPGLEIRKNGQEIEARVTK